MCPLNEIEQSERIKEMVAELDEEQAKGKAEDTRRVETLAKFQEQERVFRMAKVEELRPQFLALREDFIEAHLREIGLAPLELTARGEKIPEAIRKALPKQWEGFGLVGGFGAGKTFAIASLLKRGAERCIDDHMRKMLDKAEAWVIRGCIETRTLNLQPWPHWINWPGDIVRTRARLFENGNEVEEWLLGLQDPTRLLILDDIGADRIAGQDWTGEALARVIDDRLRNEGMTIWTSNLDTKGLVERYGPRTYSRLHALAPEIILPRLPDQRLQPRQA